MFESIKSKASKAKSSNGQAKTRSELPRTVGFVTALVGNNIRLSYAALAEAAELLGEHTPSGLSAGQRGASLVGQLPIELQPHVCRGNGSYQKGQDWDTDVPSDLRKRDFIRPENVGQFVQAYISATSKRATPAAEPAEEIEAEEDETDSAE